MGLIAVDRPSGVATRDCPHEDALHRAMDESGLGGQRVLLHTRIRAQAGGFVAPPRPEHGIGQPLDDPLGWWTLRRYPVDDQPVGTSRV